MGTRFKTANNPATSINPATFPTETGGRVGLPGAAFGWQTDVGRTLAKAMSEYIGDVTDTTRMMNLGGGVPTHVGPPRTTTSLTTIFNGTAKVIQKTATMSFALRPDPVKSIMAQEVVNESKIIVITPVVTGGGAQITPERSAAKVVSTTASAREFELARYGLDVIMNLNGAHQPEVWAEELNTKLKAQRRQMDEAWIGVTYQTIMEEGTSIIQAMLRSNPVAGVKSGRHRRIAADRMYANMFACIDKDDYPIPNMISALSFAAVNTPVDGAPSAGAVLLVPPGTLTTSKYTRDAEMSYYLSGITLPDNEKGLSVPLTNVKVDNEYNLKILTHFPPPDYTAYDSENPQVRHNELMRPVGISTYYPLNFRTFDQAEPLPAATGADSTERQDAKIGTATEKVHYGLFELGVTDFKSRNYHYFRLGDVEIIRNLRAALKFVNAPGGGQALGMDKGGRFWTKGIKTLVDSLEAGDGANRGPYVFRDRRPVWDNAIEEVDVFLLRPHLVIMMNSAIYCAQPGADTGRMMMSYPQTGVGVDRATEELLIPMRMYMGAGVVDKEQLIILNDVQGAGFVKGHGVNLCLNAQEYTPQTGDPDEEEYGIGDDLVLCCKLRSTPWTDLFNDPLFVAMNLNGPYAEMIAQKMTAEETGGEFPAFDAVKQYAEVSKDASKHSGGMELPLIPYCGTVWNTEGKKVFENNGHFEGLDDPKYCDRLEGRQRCSARRFATVD